MKKKHKSQKSKPWFIKTRGSYLPVSWQGALTYVPMILFLITVMLSSLRTAHSVSDGLYNMFPYFVCTGVVMHWVASHKI